jgi:hypothetical protein
MYLGYVAQFATSPEVRRKLEELILSNGLVFDFQRMYLLAAALSCDKVRKEVVNKALRFLDNRSVGQEVRAIAAIFAAKLGTGQQKRRVRLAYESEDSAYVRGAILYAARYFTSAERSTCKKAWGDIR